MYNHKVLVVDDDKLLRETLGRELQRSDRELKISSEIISKMNEELERRIEERSREAGIDSDERLLIKFTDNGPGILNENLQKVFEPFFATKAVGNGFGLGFSISYGIIESHKGRIKMENDLSGGMRIFVSLPVKGEQ
jgi:signal transduction histidine kinase